MERSFILTGFFILICNELSSAVDLQEVQLIGGTGEYLEVSKGIEYELQCPYRAGYDDVVKTVEWLYYGRPVYTWIDGRTTLTVWKPLLGHVDTEPTENPQNLHFTKISHDLVGNYTCVVKSSKEVAKSQPFNLRVVDVAPAEFETHVNILSASNNTDKDANNTDSSDPEDDCTLVWDFKSPAIYPRPNVTCGYYSYDHDDVTTYLPAGLSLHQLINGSWQALFDHTKVKVQDIPVHGRLGCSIKIPETTYKKLVKFDNDLVIDSKIDATGCPSPKLSKGQRIIYHVTGGIVTCRGDLVPSTRETPVEILLKCPKYYSAIFSNGSAIYEWSMRATCSHQELTWRLSDSDDLLSPNPSNSLNPSDPSDSLVVFDNLPYCIKAYSGGSSKNIFPFIWMLTIGLIYITL